MAKPDFEVSIPIASSYQSASVDITIALSDPSVEPTNVQVDVTTDAEVTWSAKEDVAGFPLTYPLPVSGSLSIGPAEGKLRLTNSISSVLLEFAILIVESLGTVTIVAPDAVATQTEFTVEILLDVGTDATFHISFGDGSPEITQPGQLKRHIVGNCPINIYLQFLKIFNRRRS